MDIQEILKEYLDELEIKYFIADHFEGSDYEGYACVYVDSDDFSIECLTQLGFEKIKPDFFIINIDKLNKIPEQEIERIKLFYSEQYTLKNSSREFHRRILNLTRLWNKIVKVYNEINTHFFRQYSLFYFQPFSETVNRALKLPLQLVRDEEGLEEFCFCLYQVGYECVDEETKSFVGNILRNKVPQLKDAKKEEIEKYWKMDLLMNDHFYNDILLLRNYYKHLKGQRKETDRKDFENKFKECLKRRMLSKLSNDYEYYYFQYKILEDFLEYLKKINTIFKTHGYFKG